MNDLKITEALITFDGDKNGQINEKELIQSVQGLGIYLTTAEQDSLINGIKFINGQCKLEDALIAIKNIAGTKNPRTTILEMVKNFDRQKNGTISEKELEEVLKIIGEVLTQAEAEELLSLASCNKRIDYTELIDTLL